MSPEEHAEGPASRGAGRVLLSSTVKSRHTDTAAQETTVLTEMETIGGEIPDQVLCILRPVRAENPDDLDSPLHIHVTVVEGEVEGEAETAEQKPGPPKLAPATSKRLATARPTAGRDTRHLFAYV